MKASEIKTIKDIDTYRYQHIENGATDSRYGTMKKLYGEQRADIMMRELEVQSWPVSSRIRI